jgi:hypothetical protein
VLIKALLNYQNKNCFMKKNHLKLISSFLLAVLFIAGCQKEAKESTESNALVNSANKARENSCRMTVQDWPTIGRWEFHYNDKGLADEWIIDLGYGMVNETMIYNDNDKLIQAIEDFFGEPYIYDFFYTGNKLSHVKRTSFNNPADFTDFQYIYNSKGQITRQDDDVNDQHIIMDYDAIGNCTKTDIYFGTDLIYSDEYTFNLPSRNPRAAVPGVNTGFPFYGVAGFTDKKNFSSNRTTIYDNGIPFLLNDYDPAQTTINTSNHNYPVSADYFDLISQGNINVTYEYENCNGNSGIAKFGNSQANMNSKAKITTRYTRPLLMRASAKSIKEQIQKMKQQLEK